MSAQHTPGAMIAIGRWVENICDDKPDLVTSDGIGGNTDEEQCANARRIAACWNAAEGIETYQLELMVGDLSIENQIKCATSRKPTGKKTAYRIQRDELLAALNGLLAYFESGNSVPVSQATIKATSPEVIAARAAIAKAEGGGV